jgi:hypothetical protein
MISWKEQLLALLASDATEGAESSPSKTQEKQPESSTASIPESPPGTSHYVPAEVVYAFAGHDPRRWRYLVGCRVRLRGRGFGEVKRVDDNLILWVLFDTVIGEERRSPSELDAVKASLFERGPVTSVVFPPKSEPELLRELDKIREARSLRQCSIESVAAPTPSPKSRAEAIKDFCHERDIEFLVHFTRMGNLDHILKHGLVSRTQVDEWRTQHGGNFPLVCDEERWDDHRNAICSSGGALRRIRRQKFWSLNPFR